MRPVEKPGGFLWLPETLEAWTATAPDARWWVGVRCGLGCPAGRARKTRRRPICRHGAVMELQPKTGAQPALEVLEILGLLVSAMGREPMTY